MPPVGWFLDKIIKLSKKWFRKLRIFRLMSYNITAQTSKSQDTVFFRIFTKFLLVKCPAISYNNPTSEISIFHIPFRKTTHFFFYPYYHILYMFLPSQQFT